ncbi:unnamed protein product, partial [Polarella glacialis]
ANPDNPAEETLQASSGVGEVRGPLGGAWLAGTRLGEQDTAVRAAGSWLQENWDRVGACAPEEGGLFCSSQGCEAEGGPPNRLKQLQDLEAAAGQWELDCPRASALHCAFALLFWVHQQAVAFQPNLSITAAGQKSGGSQQQLFNVILKACSLSQQVTRDVRNLAYARYGREQHGLKDVSQYARGAAEEIRKHAAALREHINNTMADSII